MAYFLGEQDRQRIAEAVARIMGQRVDGKKQESYIGPGAASNVLIAKIPSGGIDAFDPTDVCSVSGTSRIQVPSGTCTFYYPAYDATCGWHLMPLNDAGGSIRSDTVLNANLSELAANSYCVAVKDRFGVWWALGNGS